MKLPMSWWISVAVLVAEYDIAIGLLPSSSPQS
jgi:hypothetical protein